MMVPLNLLLFRHRESSSAGRNHFDPCGNAYAPSEMAKSDIIPFCTSAFPERQANSRTNSQPKATPEVTSKFDGDGKLFREKVKISYLHGKCTHLRLYKGYLSTSVVRRELPCRRAKP
jgi:hypothetical protein